MKTVEKLKIQLELKTGKTISIEKIIELLNIHKTMYSKSKRGIK